MFVVIFIAVIQLRHRAGGYLSPGSLFFVSDQDIL